MVTRREMMKTMAAGSAAFAAMFASGLAMAEAGGKVAASMPGGGKGVKVTELMRKDIPDMKGKQVSVVTVTYAPGASSSPHRHPGSVFAYVLEGAVVSQVEPGKPTTYTQGQMWYELPMHLHRISRNASTTEQARILAFLIMNKGQKLVLPA
ncbi:MAG: cupin domain-containing protein [Candidatus Binataceae bacterium]